MLSGSNDSLVRLAVNLVNESTYFFNGNEEKIIVEPSSDCQEVYDSFNNVVQDRNLE